jgi:hypothetical protein
MRLAADGTSPGPPDGVALLADGVPGPYLGFPAIQLQAQMVRDGYAVRSFPWDWRMAIYPAGQALAAVIRQGISADDPCTIVGHSAGGLVARAAWTDLGTSGDQARVRRIVTLGTPHWGSYNVPLFWMGNSETIEILNYWNQSVGGNTAGYAPAVTGYQRLDATFYAALARTWPGLYDCLPVLGAPDASTDPNRSALFDAGNWPSDAAPEQVWLDHAKNVTGPWLRGAASQPPANVLTSVYGFGSSVASQLVNPAALGDPASVGAYVDGDGTVSVASASLATGTLYGYVLDHADLLPALVARGDLRELILEANPSPAPPPVVSTQLAALPALGPLPAGVLPLSNVPAQPNCRSGVCPC